MSSFEPVRVGLVGVGNFARSYLAAVKQLEAEGLATLAAVVVRNPAKYPDACEDLRSRGVEIAPSLDDLLGLGERIELVGLPTPIHTHADMTIAALDAGFHVLVEKPPAATIQEVDAMIAARDRAGKLCAVGFQLITDAGIQAIKRMACEGELGEILHVSANGRWKRLRSYYARCPWAGKYMLDGRYVLDGPLNNPLAHILNNELYCASREPGELAAPLRVQAELYKGHDFIESENTSCLRAELDNGATLTFAVTLCAGENYPQQMEVIGERGSVFWEFAGQCVHRDAQGRERALPYGKETAGKTINCFRNMVEAIRDPSKRLFTPIEATRNFTLTLNAAFESGRAARQIPAEYIERAPVGDDDESVRVRDIEDIVERAFRERKLFSELGVPWAAATSPFETAGYREFAMTW